MQHIIWLHTVIIIIHRRVAAKWIMWQWAPGSRLWKTPIQAIRAPLSPHHWLYSAGFFLFLVVNMFYIWSSEWSFRFCVEPPCLWWNSEFALIKTKSFSCFLSWERRRHYFPLICFAENQSSRLQTDWFILSKWWCFQVILQLHSVTTFHSGQRINRTMWCIKGLLYILLWNKFEIH